MEWLNIASVVANLAISCTVLGWLIVEWCRYWVAPRAAMEDDDGIISKQRQQHRPATDKHSESDSHEQTADIASAIKAIEKHLEAEAKERDKRDDRRYCLEVLAVIVASIYAVITFFLWFTSHRQLNAMLLSQRPWLLLRDIAVDGNFEQTGNGNFVAEVGNEGANPAFDIHIFYVCFPAEFVSTDEAFAHLKSPVFDLAVNGMLPPGQWPYLGKDGRHSWQHTVSVDPDALRTKTIAVYCIGGLLYKGPDFATDYSTAFARRYFPHPKRIADEGARQLRDLGREKGKIGVVITASNDADSDFMTIGGSAFNYAR